MYAPLNPAILRLDAPLPPLYPAPTTVNALRTPVIQPTAANSLPSAVQTAVYALQTPAILQQVAFTRLVYAMMIIHARVIPVIFLLVHAYL